MKRLTAAIITVFFTSFMCHAIIYSFSDLERNNIKGKVKSMSTFYIKEDWEIDEDTIAKYQALNIPVPEQRTPYKYEEFNERGMITLEDEFFWNWRNIYTLDAINQKVPVKDERYNFAGDLIRLYTIEIDEEGYPVYGIAVDGDGNKIFEEYYVKKRNLKTKELTLSSSHKSDSSETDYSILYGADGKMKKFVMKGDRKETTYFFNEKEMPYISIVDRYDMFSDTPETEKLEIEYLPDAKNVYLILEDGSRQIKIKEKLDRYGNTVEEVRFDYDGSISLTVVNNYTYDEQGNWIRQETYKDGQLDKIKERDFTYY